MISVRNKLTGNIKPRLKLTAKLNVSTIEIYPTLEDLTVTPTKEQQTFTHDNSYGYDKVIVEPIPEIRLQDKEVIPTEDIQTIKFDSEYDGLNQVIVNSIPDEYSIPTGTLEITTNGEHNVKDYEKVVADIHEVSKYTPKYISFYMCKLDNIDEELRNLDTSNLTTMSYMFAYSSSSSLDVSEFITSNVTDMSYMFTNCAGVKTLDVSNFITSNVTNMRNMFESMSSLTSLDLSNFDTSKVTDMYAMFARNGKCESYNVSSFDTSNVTTMYNMFTNNNALKSIDVSNFNTSKVKSMYAMFRYDSGLTSIDLSSFDTSEVTNNQYMLSSCTSLTTLIINNPNVFKMTNTNMLSQTPIADGTGYVYVPDDLVDTYKTTTNWSTYANQIKGISELPT